MIAKSTALDGHGYDDDDVDGHEVCSGIQLMEIDDDCHIAMQKQFNFKALIF